MSRTLLLAGCLCLTARASFGGDLGPKQPPLTVKVLPSVSAKADGAIVDKEYQLETTDPKTGIVVLASADSAVLHMALRSPGAGWLSIGFGSPGMNGSVMVIAMQDGRGKWTVEQHLGKPFYRHQRAPKPALLSGAAWQEGGKTCLEFSIPLRYAEGKQIAAGTETPFILAYHRDKGALSKHTKKTSGAVTLAE